MSLKINRDTLNKLTHESIEIRLRTFEQLSSKLNRALVLNENIEFCPGDLCKQLIRWFVFLPPQQPLKVLNTLKCVIESPKYGSKAIDKLGSARIVKELRKMQTLFDSNSAEFNIINKIKEHLKNMAILEDNKEKLKKSKDIDELIDCVSNTQIHANVHGYSCEDYETPWSSPSPSDYTSMKFLSDILINKFATNVEIENAVYHLQLTMADYPAEYMLQAPHIFQNLLQIYDERKNGKNRIFLVDSVASALLQFLLTLEERLKMLRNSMTFNQVKDCSNRQEKLQTACQLKTEKALTELFDASIFHLESHAYRDSVSSIVWEIVFIVLTLLKNIDGSMEKCLNKVALLATNLSVKIHETDHCAKLRLYQMLLIFVLQDAHVHLCSSPLKALDICKPLLRDYAMKSFFTKRHKHIEDFILTMDKSLNEKYKLVNLYERSLETSIQMLTNKFNRSSCNDIIKEGHIVCSVLDVLQSKKLIDVLFDGVIQGISHYPANVEMKAQAIDLLLKLLNLTFMPIKTYVYEKLANLFKRHIGCLMTGERYVSECSNADLLKAHIVGVPFSKELLLQLVHESFESSCEQIRSNCINILEIFLQSKTLFGTNWYILLPLIVPLLPLLNCCTRSEKMMHLLLKLFHPDSRELPYVCVLQGNLGFLFHSSAVRRSESLTRLIYTLNSLKGAENYVPNLLEISDTIPNDICIQNTPREYRNVFSDRLPVSHESITSLNNLLHLLESPDVEPLVRKTTLMQVNVLCSNWNVTAELCSTGAYYLILQALENALQKSSELDYADTAVPAISVLNKVMLYDATVRCELAGTPNIYVLLLRTLMLFHHDIQVRQDATICLFQLIFSSHLISTENSIEGPLILGNIIIPLDITLSPAFRNKIHQGPEKISEIFVTASEETQYWRMVVASSCCSGLTNITRHSINILSQLDIRDDLKLNSQDVRLVRATQPSVSLNRLLKAASNATDHKSLIQACQLLNQQLIVPTLKNTFSVNDELCMEINNILRRYLQMPPGNKHDLDLYEHLLDVARICLKIPLVLVALEIFKLLQKDRRHALLTILTQGEEVPLRIFMKITALLRLLIKDNKHVFKSHLNASKSSTFYNNLFDLFIERCLQLFEIRDLQRVRCLLSLMVIISSCQLDTSDQILFFYCRRFAQLSLGLKSFTQTGAQWHRDCLLTILQLSDQMQFPKENFRLSAGFVKYLSGLCGHRDVEVRTLAWSILNVTAKTNAINTIETDRKSSDISGTELLINELSYLPGGFMACCITTFLDTEEVICVRHLAGQLLAVLIRSHAELKEIEELVENHQFIRSATESLSSSVCILEKQIPRDMSLSTVNITTCELVSCYSLICIELSQRSPDFLRELCKTSFMFKLYEILKQPPPLSKHIGYLNMIGHICQLYTLCYSQNLIFLEHTICRDDAWLQNFCEILFTVVAPCNVNYVTINMLQLFLILCKDSAALEELSIKLRDYAKDVVKLFQSALSVVNLKTSLQSCCLSILSLLMAKSQSEVDADLSVHILALFESQNVLIKSIKNDEMHECDKENYPSNQRGNDYNFGKDKTYVNKIDISKSSISEHMCISLIRLFNHLYPVKVCTFSAPPTASQQHVAETLALLLKQSAVAQETAKNLKFEDQVIKTFNNFLEEYGAKSCTAYVKRNGENKKLAVIKNLQLLLKLLLTWYSSPAMIITDNILAVDYSKIIIKIWPWLAHSEILKITLMQFCSFLSVHSLVVCKQFSTLNSSSFPHSILQLVSKMITSETLKIKANSTDCSTLISTGLSVLVNCCSCLEGRTALNKIHVLNVFDSLYPFNPKTSQSKLYILIAWLEFWEFFSRYDEGAQSHHLNALCSVVNKSLPGSSKRLISLRILRNMAFLNSNRSTLITSTEFTYTVNEIVSQPIKDSVEEQFVVCVALWKLISGGIKFVAMIRGTKLAKNLRLLKESLAYTNNEKDEILRFSNNLLHVLNIIFNIFNN